MSLVTSFTAGEEDASAEFVCSCDEAGLRNTKSAREPPVVEEEDCCPGLIDEQSRRMRDGSDTDRIICRDGMKRARDGAEIWPKQEGRRDMPYFSKEAGEGSLLSHIINAQKTCRKRPFS